MPIQFWVKRATHVSGAVAVTSRGMIAGSAACQLPIPEIGLIARDAVSEGK